MLPRLGEPIIGKYSRYVIANAPIRCVAKSSCRHRNQQPPPLLCVVAGCARSGLRFYNPDAGRWLNRDPIGEAGALPIYAFVNNRPIEALDALGLRCQSLGSLKWGKTFNITPFAFIGWDLEAELFSCDTVDAPMPVPACSECYKFSGKGHIEVGLGFKKAGKLGASALGFGFLIDYSVEASIARSRTEGTVDIWYCRDGLGTVHVYPYSGKWYFINASAGPRLAASIAGGIEIGRWVKIFGTISGSAEGSMGGRLGVEISNTSGMGRADLVGAFYGDVRLKSTVGYRAQVGRWRSSGNLWNFDQSLLPPQWRSGPGRADRQLATLLTW